MIKRRFADEQLRRITREWRTESEAGLLQVVAEHGDNVRAIISPEPDGSIWLLNGEERRWNNEIKRGRRRISYSTMLLCASIMTCRLARNCMLGSQEHSLTFYVAVLAIAAAFSVGVLSLMALLLSGFSFTRDYCRGCAQESLDVLSNYARSVWIIGDHGVYVVLNDAPINQTPDVEFLAYDDVAPLALDVFEDDAVLTLCSASCGLVRVMIFPIMSRDRATEAVHLISERVHR